MIQCINGMQSIIEGTRSKMLQFEQHSTIENTVVKLKAIYNPLKRFAHQFMPGYEIPQSHETTEFSMLYQEYHQRELYLLHSDIFWLTSSIKKSLCMTASCTRGSTSLFTLLARVVKFFKDGQSLMICITGIQPIKHIK